MNKEFNDADGPNGIGSNPCVGCIRMAGCSMCPYYDRLK